MRSPILFPTGRAWLGSIRSNAWWIISCRRRDSALRLLASHFRRLAAQHRRRADASHVGLRVASRAAERTNWFQPHADRRAQSERHQGSRGAVAGCVVDGGGAGRRDAIAGIDGGRAADVPFACTARKAGGEHRSHQRRQGFAERVSSWWAEEAKKYGVHFDEHDDR